MNGFIVIVLLVVGFLLLVNGRDIVKAIWTSERKYPSQRIDRGDYALTKPAGFKVSDESHLFMIQSANVTGAIAIVDGRRIQEEFNCAWAVVSVTSGDGIEICRGVAKEHSDEVLSESEEIVDGNRVLTITAQRKTPAYFVIQTTHKAVMSLAHNKTYELRVSTINNQPPKYGKAANQILESFEVLPPAASVAS
ncbi:MAG: hypothetical protein AAF810_24170 [Cyanobacteria bacterium P01_D01_bin.36]